MTSKCHMLTLFNTGESIMIVIPVWIFTFLFLFFFGGGGGIATAASATFQIANWREVCKPRILGTKRQTSHQVNVGLRSLEKVYSPAAYTKFCDAKCVQGHVDVMQRVLMLVVRIWEESLTDLSMSRRCWYRHDNDM